MPWDLLDIPHGTVVVDKLRSEALKQVKPCVVYLPPGYESSTKSYPVLYLLHGGGGGDSLEWVSEGHADNIMDYLISRGRAREMILGHAGSGAAAVGRRRSAWTRSRVAPWRPPS